MNIKGNQAMHNAEKKYQGLKSATAYIDVLINTPIIK
jgi:hypothetical protein